MGFGDWKFRPNQTYSSPPENKLELRTRPEEDAGQRNNDGGRSCASEEVASKEEGWPEYAGELILLSPEIALGRKKICRGRNGKEGNFLGFFCVIYPGRGADRVWVGFRSEIRPNRLKLSQNR